MSFLAVAGVPAVALAGEGGASYEVGAGIAAWMDLPDGVSDQVGFGPGGALEGFVRREISEALALRAGLELGVGTGQDRLEWVEDGVPYYSDSHWSLLTRSALMAGAELTVAPTSRLRPSWGLDLGLAHMGTWHSVNTDSVALLDPAQNDPNNPRNIDPYASQFAPVVGARVQVRVASPGNLAIDVGAGYRVSVLKPVALKKTPDDTQASRAALGLNTVQVGVTATAPFGRGTDR